MQKLAQVFLTVIDIKTNKINRSKLIALIALEVIIVLFVVLKLSGIKIPYLSSRASNNYSGALADPNKASGAPAVDTIRSVTVYSTSGTLGDSGLYPYLEKTLPAIKANGFNTIWFVTVWTNFDPTPLAPNHQYNSQAFENTRQVLSLLQRNNMRAIIGLNYLGTGWSPDFNNDGRRDATDFCDWLSNPSKYQSFERYTQQFLSEISDYHNIVYPTVFTENSEPCGWADTAHAKQLATLLRSTLGSLPTRMPAKIRPQFTFGYHDYSIINLGWGNGDSPIASPNPYDFVSMVGYGMDNVANNQIAVELDARAARFKNLYPKMPLLIGEAGATNCNNQDANQARVDLQIAAYAKKRNYGLNIWGWQPGPPAGDCNPNLAYGGLALTNQDGSLKKAAKDLKAFFATGTVPTGAAPVISGAGLNTSYNPWVIWVTASNLSANSKIRLLDATGAQWGGDIPTSLSADKSWLSASLPGNSPPSRCNAGKTCNISVQIVDSAQGLVSGSYTLQLPAVQ